MTDTTTYEAFRNALNALKPGWTFTGKAIIGPGGAAVRLSQRHDARSEGHVDVAFTLNDEAPVKTELWDCVAGLGATHAARAAFAAGIWAQTTAGALLELKYSRRGEFADHLPGDDPGGLQGWHVICGAIMGFGKGGSPAALQRWWLENPVLPAIGRALHGSLAERTCPHGIKILFGSDDVAEVRLDGDYHGPASKALAGLGWPRLDPPGFVRSYAIVVGPEGRSAGTQ